MMQQAAYDLPHVNLVFIGPSGSGKSTMLGHLIAESGAIDADNLQRIFDEAKDLGYPERCYAWILDKLSCEKQRGSSMYIAMWRLASRRCRFTIMDAPGHSDFSKDMVTAMSQADIAVLVVPAAEELEQEKEGQLREHTLLAYTLGLRRMVVCVNKMDADAVRFSQERFLAACQVVREGLNAAGLKTHDVYFDVHFVPSSGWFGDNVTSRSDNMPWYCGPTLIEALDETVASHFKPDRPLRFPLQEVMKVGGKGTVVVGRVATGSFSVGSRLLFAPGQVQAQVTSITMQHEVLDEASSGHMVSVCLDVEMSELKRGMVGSSVDDNPARECSSFVAQVIVLSDPRAGAIHAGSELTVLCHTAQVLCAFQELLSRTDRRTGQVLGLRPTELRAGDAAVVRLKPLASLPALCVEAFEEYPALGRFSVHDQKITVAVGVVQKVEHAAPAAVPRAPRILRSAPKPRPKRLHRPVDSGEEQEAPVLMPSLPPASPTRRTRSGYCSVSQMPSPFAAFGAVAASQARRAAASPKSAGSEEMSPDSPE
ncbi:Elongation factor 1-alpha (EF-1-alpha) (50 kDa actin-binding protein) (ABP-50) [Durusdinium trenchii]|uniref:Elongation factor 1-alpha (EF-1-alpha) (50 kDa actin-binding protein) (ABP-50) n=2 Tax=Durusdinium trenchii TaxID=1381693 RepID=A0ABP0NIU2_9DINO